MLTKKFRIKLEYESIVDVTLIIKNNAVNGFVINYRSRISGEWHDIYRVDTCHGYLHEQRFWRSPEPIRLPETAPLKLIFDFYLDEIKNNYERYLRYYKNALQNR